MFGATLISLLSTTMHLGVLGGNTPLKLPFLSILKSGCHKLLTPSIGGILNILEFGCHKLLNAQGLIIVTLSLHGWEVFSTPGILTHARITWALSPMAPQTQMSLWGSPCANGVANTPHGEVHNNMLVDQLACLEVIV